MSGVDLEVGKITEKLLTLIDIQARARTRESDVVRGRYLQLKTEIKILHEQAEDLYRESLKAGLTLNSLETEGYLRCTKEILTLIEDIEKTHH